MVTSDWVIFKYCVFAFSAYIIFLAQGQKYIAAPHTTKFKIEHIVLNDIFFTFLLS